MNTKPTPIPDTEPAPPLSKRFMVRVPVQTRPLGPIAARGWRLQHFNFEVEADNEEHAVEVAFRQIRNTQVVLPVFETSFDDFAEEEEPAVGGTIPGP